jgi:hypothetical protein
MDKKKPKYEIAQYRCVPRLSLPGASDLRGAASVPRVYIEIAKINVRLRIGVLVGAGTEAGTPSI